jgi:hypothetical protein
LWVPAKIELASSDKTEGLIGQSVFATFKVTTADGHPAAGVLVDFDTQMSDSDFYVGNIDPEAQVTNSAGEVTVAMLSTEPGTQRISASVKGVETVYTTRYWLAVDEVYNTKGATAQNNAGVEHEWAVRVVVFGPGPRSTSLSDWYNAIDADYDPSNINVEDGIDYYDYYDDEYDEIVTADGWSIADEELLADYGYTPRGLAGVQVEWSIYNQPDDPKTTQTNESLTSVGNITKVDGVSITPAKTAVGKTTADGLTTITVLSKDSGVTFTKAVADYPKNPYPEQLFNHMTFNKATWWHNYDWDEQPAPNATQKKTWIAHTISDGTEVNPISPSYSAPNVGEEKTLVLTLLDSYGNPIAGRNVEWYMQGVGFFQTDDSGDKSDPIVAENNVDYDITDAAGKAKLFVKSYDSGEQIIHAKVRDKGTGGSEGTFLNYTAEVQWFDADIATFDDITTQRIWVDKYTDVNDGVKDDYWKYLDEALSANALGTQHTFTLSVYGLKLEYDPTIDEPDGQTPFVDSDYSGASYDGIFDKYDAEYFGGLLMWPSDPKELKEIDDKVKSGYVYSTGSWPNDADNDGIIEADNNGKDPGGVDERGTIKVKVAGKWLTMSFEGAYTMYDYDDDAYPEPFAGQPGVYLPLAGKNVTFQKANSFALLYTNLGAYFDGEDVLVSQGSSPSSPVAAVTDANGKASLTITNVGEKGPETIRAIVTWPGNPHSAKELQTAYAKKTWMAGNDASAASVIIRIFVDGIEVANNLLGWIEDGYSVAWTIDDNGDRALNSAHVEVHVYDLYGNDLPDYEVVYLLENINGWLGGTQDAYDTYVPWAYLTDLDVDDYVTSEDTFYDTNGTRPDHNEPTFASDPYAYIVGDGGTQSFFFNQWLGSDKPVAAGQAGLGQWYTTVPGMGFSGYHASINLVKYTMTWASRYGSPPDPLDVFNGFDPVPTLEDSDPPLAPAQIGLATDGAKAWTLDGFFIPQTSSEVVPNLYTGSGIDVQLADDITTAGQDDIDVESILRVMVYPPSDGLVKEGDYIWSYQVHQIWEAPIPTSITLAVTPDYAIAGSEFQTLTATVLDQFGNPMPNVELTVNSSRLEGNFTPQFTDSLTLPTDEFGNVVIGPWSQDPGDWGVEKVVASAGDVDSDPAFIQWIFDDSLGLGIDIDDNGVADYGPNLVSGTNGGTLVTVIAGFTPWNGRTLIVYSAPGGAGISQGRVYVDTSPLDITTISALGTAFFVNASNSTNTDGRPNWVYDKTP